MNRPHSMDIMAILTKINLNKKTVNYLSGRLYVTRISSIAKRLFVFFFSNLYIFGYYSLKVRTKRKMETIAYNLHVFDLKYCSF